LRYFPERKNFAKTTRTHVLDFRHFFQKEKLCNMRYPRSTHGITHGFNHTTLSRRIPGAGLCARHKGFSGVPNEAPG
jgi:hypothetical protein